MPDHVAKVIHYMALVFVCNQVRRTRSPASPAGLASFPTPTLTPRWQPTLRFVFTLRLCLRSIHPF